MMKVYQKNDKTLKYEIIYKPIKHIYLRKRDDVVIVTANKKTTESYILNLLDKHFDKFYQVQKPRQFEVPKYQLWGNELTIDEFFGPYKQTDKNYELILKKEVLDKIETFMPRLILDLEKLNLKPVEMTVKKLKGKYGVCRTVKKEITLSSFLARIHPEYLYYVLLHEYAHLIVANHSKSFYNVLDKVMINHKLVQKQLRKHIISY